MRQIFVCIGFLLLGCTLIAQEEIDKQIAALEDSVKVNIGIYGENSEEVANAYFSLYDILFEKFQYDEAFTIAEKCLDVCIEVFGVKHSSTKASYKNLKEVYGVKVFEDNIKVQIELYGEEHEEVVNAYFDLSKFLYDIGQYQKMNEASTKCLNICLNIFGENNLKTGSNYYNFGLSYFKTEDYAKAIDYFQKALSINIVAFGDKHLLIATAYNYIGLSFSKLKNYSNAIEHYSKAFDIYENVLDKEHDSIGTLYKNIGKIYLQMQDYHNAIKNLKKAEKIKIKVWGVKHYSLYDIYMNIKFSYYGLGDFKDAHFYDMKAINHLYKGTGKKRQRIHWNSKKYLKYNNWIVNRKVEHVERIIPNNKPTEYTQPAYIDTNRLTYNDIYNKLEEVELFSEDELEQKGWNADSLIMLAYEYESNKRTFHYNPHDSLIPKPTYWYQLQEKLKADEALIDYFAHYIWSDSVLVYQVMLIKKNQSKPIFIPLSETSPVIELQEVKNNIPQYLQYRDSRINMYSYIWKALEKHLKNIKTIHIIPDASISKIDFESLQNDEGQYLADLYHFHYYLTCGLFLKKTQDQHFINANIYGHITYSDDQKALCEALADSFKLRLLENPMNILPNALEEIEMIDSICNKNGVIPKLFTMDTANEDTIRYFTGIRSPSLIHIATHGIYLPPLKKIHSIIDEFWTIIEKPVKGVKQIIPAPALSVRQRFQAISNPFQRAILFLSSGGDTWLNGPNKELELEGILTAKEIAMLDFRNTKLVVLSACSSGIGSQDINHVAYGFPRTFKLAGVDKILVSLWPVEDETTKELMILFYTNLLQHKQDAATALRNAKAEMRKRDDRPKKWAGFVLVE